MPQTEARKTLKDAPVMWRRINSIGVILDCNSTYAANLGYAKSEIIGKPIFEHVPKESWESMNDSLKIWFETGKVTDRKITFIRQDKSTFSGLLQATSLYDEKNNLVGFDPDIGAKLAEMLGVELELVKVGSPDRIPFVSTGKIDIVMGALTRNYKRQKEHIEQFISQDELIEITPLNLRMRKMELDSNKRISAAKKKKEGK